MPSGWARINEVRAQFVHFDRGQVLFYEGHQPCGVYLICRGKVRLTPAGRGISRKPTMVTGGRPLGFATLLQDGVYSATAEAATRVDALFIGRFLFRPWIRVRKKLGGEKHGAFQAAAR